MSNPAERGKCPIYPASAGQGTPNPHTSLHEVLRAGVQPIWGNLHLEIVRHGRIRPPRGTGLKTWRTKRKDRIMGGSVYIGRNVFNGISFD